MTCQVESLWYITHKNPAAPTCCGNQTAFIQVSGHINGTIILYFNTFETCKAAMG